MRTLTLRRIPAIAAVAFSALLRAQSPSIPPSQSPSTDTALPATSTTAAPAAPVPPAQAPPRRAQISFVNGELAIAAYNSSLNQILREVARLTGIKITGGVNEERVFGNYGPAPTGEVLRSLLDGTGSNILFVHATDDKPSELVLTPRMGGPTPPSPHAVAFDDTSDNGPSPQIQPISQPSESQSSPAPQNAAPQPIAPAPANNNTGNSTNSPDPNQPQNPNGVKTPQQIFEQLQRLRQQQQQQQQSNPQ